MEDSKTSNYLYCNSKSIKDVITVPRDGVEDGMAVIEALEALVGKIEVAITMKWINLYHHHFTNQFVRRDCCTLCLCT